MKVRDLMTKQVRTCGLNADLATVAMQMWAGDCGIVPIVGDDGRLAGVLTDRDICMAVATKHRLVDDIRASEMVGRTTFSCSGNDDVQDALRLMAERRVRRLPVVDREGRVEGMVSMNDMVLAAVPVHGKKGDAPSFVEAMETMKSISAHRFAIVPETYGPVATV